MIVIVLLIKFIYMFRIQMKQSIIMCRMPIKILKIKLQAENLIADLISDKKLNQISTDLFIREKI